MNKSSWCSEKERKKNRYTQFANIWHL